MFNILLDTYFLSFVIFNDVSFGLGALKSKSATGIDTIFGSSISNISAILSPKSNFEIASEPAKLNVPDKSFAIISSRISAKLFVRRGSELEKRLNQ